MCQPPGELAPVEFKSAVVDGLNLFYREAGPKGAPVIVLLHGFPSSSTMFSGLLPRLGLHYHVIAPDYPGFGHSDAPSPGKFTYTFDHLADSIDKLLGQLSFTRYALYMQDYGGPIGFRIAIAHPERVTALIIQNAAAYEEGLSDVWELRRAFWKDRAATESKMRESFLSLEAARQRHIVGSAQPERIDPDTWTTEYQFLNGPGMDKIQLDLAYDYRNNVASYPKWQDYLRRHQPPLMVFWGKGDRIFTIAGAQAYQRDVPAAEVHLLNASHFALDENAELAATLIPRFLTHALTPVSQPGASPASSP
jgi:pimeloyl-ACP methyl ester carboxylesterase